MDFPKVYFFGSLRKSLLPITENPNFAAIFQRLIINGYFVFLIIFHSVIGIFALYRMKIRDTRDNPDSQFTAMPQTITPIGMELNPITEPIEEPSKTEDLIEENRIN